MKRTKYSFLTILLKYFFYLKVIHKTRYFNYHKTKHHEIKDSPTPQFKN